MAKKLKRYKVSADDSLGLAFSVVDRPAVESEFAFFSEQKVENFVAAEGERRMIYGCALRPSFPIYRNNGGEEYYLEFDADAIDKISKNYFKMGFQDSWTESHKNEVEGLTITESWIKESMTLDKSIALGLDASLPVGSWFIGCYCENDDIWNAVKEGKYHGFSIEAIVGVEEFESNITKQNNDYTMTNEEMFSKIKEMFNQLIASVSFTKQEEETKIEPIEPIAMEDLAEETPAPTETPTEEPKVEETPTEETIKVEEKVDENGETIVTIDKVNEEEAPKEDTKHFEDLINSMKSEIEALKELNNGLKTKVKELSKEPSTKPVNTNAKPSPSDTYSAWREVMRGYLG